MNLRSKLATAVGAVALVAAAAYAPTAAADRVGFNISIGGPGYAVSAGNYGYYDYWRPAPVVVAPYVPRYYAAPIVVERYPAYRPYRYYDRGHRHHHDRYHHHRRDHRHHHHR